MKKLTREQKHNRILVYALILVSLFTIFGMYAVLESSKKLEIEKSKEKIEEINSVSVKSAYDNALLTFKTNNS